MGRDLGAMAVLLPLLAACASGPVVSAVAVPPVPAGAGRIWFYRDATPVGLTVRAPIVVNGAAVGESVPDSAFYRDAPPGPYVVSAGADAEDAVPVVVTAGGETFVRTTVVPGFFAGRVKPVAVDPREGRAAVSRRVFAGGAP